MGALSAPTTSETDVACHSSRLPVAGCRLQVKNCQHPSLSTIKNSHKKLPHVEFKIETEIQMEIEIEIEIGCGIMQMRLCACARATTAWDEAQISMWSVDSGIGSGRGILWALLVGACRVN